ncbi:MAG TPA: GuaB3 family IMP dehydrogenase-related protein, partial [bacterium]|nr:GuaB3 family IMP dehydrogenase-related protein [bacterium]HEX67743.1 GuaB3 family IMP dehydrogenase-related protein [bacterium]
MSEWIGINRRARRCYGFDEISLVPGRRSINPEDVDTSVELCGFKFDIPIIAAAMDGVVDPKFAVEMSKLGGFGILNLEGVYTRYEDPYEVIDKIVSATDEEATRLVQEIYLEPIKEELIYKRIREIKEKDAICVVSSIPQKATKFGKIAEEAGADIFVIQATVLTVEHFSSSYESVDLAKFCKEMKIP